MIIKETIYIDTDKITDFGDFKEYQQAYTPNTFGLGNGKRSSRVLIFTKEAEFLKAYESVYEVAKEYNASITAIYRRLSNKEIKVVKDRIYILEKNVNKHLIELLKKIKKKNYETRKY